jgi:hypothetical protein
MRTTSLLALVATSLASGIAAQGALTSNCFISPLGTALNMFDDDVSQNNALGFTFPGPAGPVTAIDISSNGFVWLGSNTNSACCNGDPTVFLTDMARIAPMWMDLNPSQDGDVYFTSFPASGSQPAGAAVTWAGVPEFGDVVPMTLQLQMYADGSFSFMYGANCYNGFHDVLIGVTEGTAAVANAIDFATTTAGSPHFSNTNPTVFELQQASFDIADRMFVFIPNGTGGYVVLDRPSCPLAAVSAFGIGCPKPASAYEHFVFPTTPDLSNTAIEFTAIPGGGFVGVPATGFFTGTTNALTFFDDEVQGPFALPFTWNYPGGSTAAIDISSNGFIWLQTGNTNPRCCDGDPGTFLFDPASICALWMDLYPPGGGNIYFDVVGTTEAHITWSNVPEYFSGPPQTMQITLRSDGSFRLAYQSVSSTGHSPLVGFTQGSALVDPGSSDFSVGPILIGAGGIPLVLHPQVGSVPTLGSTYVMELEQISGSVVGLMVLGITGFPTGIDLSGIGMEGCELYASLDVLLTLPLSGPPTPFNFSVPATPTLAGATFYAQGATLTPGVNTLGIATSNGLGMTAGF